MPGNPPAPRWFVTADDFGYTSAINHAVMTGLREGYISHASLMVNMPGTEEACELARLASVNDRIGCHLNLAEGVPLTDQMRACRRFCEDGRYKDPLSRSRFLPLGSEDTQVLSGEIRAQIAAVRRWGFPAEHLDSHRYVHTAPNIAGTVVRVAREMGIVRVRPYQNCGPTAAGMNAAGVKMLGKALFNQWLAWHGLKQVDYFGGIDDLRWLAGRGTRGISSAEVMTHPCLGADAVVMDGLAGPLRARVLELQLICGASFVASRPRQALR